MIEKTTANLFSLDETEDVGIDGATPVVESYASNKGKLLGKVLHVTIDIDPKL